ncbi:MAG: C69 family dipeptidase [Clostridiales bacterium]|nr:C69 family dipeptidase [Clostridiales bacterium]
MQNRKLLKLAVAFALVLTLLAPMNMWAFAAGDASVADGDEGKCTSVYFGKDTTDSGACFYGRTEDYSYSWRKVLWVEPAATHEPGDMFVSNESGSSFRWPYPEQTLRYQTCPDSYYNERNGRTSYGEIAMNEAGVVVSATVTLNSPRSQITSATGGNDPLVRNDGGLMEIDTPDLVLMSAKTAREGIEILAEICDVRGASGCEGTQIGDPNEVWFFQVLSGHQYVGVKCPPDMVGLSPNMTANVGFNGYGGENGYLDVTDTENVIASPGLIATAQKAGTYVGNAEGTAIKIADSYVSNTYNHTTNARLRNGFGYFFGLTTQAEINALFPVATKTVDYFITPPADKKYSLYEAMRMLADTGQGAAWAVAGTTNGQSIGNENTQEAHIIEQRPWMPDELATIEWIAMGPAEFSVYLPFFGNLITDVFDKFYISDHQSYIQGDPYANSFWHTFRGLHNLSTRGTVTASNTTVTIANKAKYGAGVKAFWERYQKSLIEQQAVVDKALEKYLAKEGREATEALITSISMAVQEEAYDYAQMLTAELKAYVAAGAAGNFVPSYLDDEDAVPTYAALVKILDEAAPSASVAKLNGNKNELTVTVTEYYFDDSVNIITKTFLIDNNAAGTYDVEGYKVYVDTKGNTQIRECRFVQ